VSITTAPIISTSKHKLRIPAARFSNQQEEGRSKKAKVAKIVMVSDNFYALAVCDVKLLY